MSMKSFTRMWVKSTGTKPLNMREPKLRSVQNIWEYINARSGQTEGMLMQWMITIDALYFRPQISCNNEQPTVHHSVCPLGLTLYVSKFFNINISRFDTHVVGVLMHWCIFGILMITRSNLVIFLTADIYCENIKWDRINFTIMVYPGK